MMKDQLAEAPRIANFLDVPFMMKSVNKSNTNINHNIKVKIEHKRVLIIFFHFFVTRNFIILCRIQRPARGRCENNPVLSPWSFISRSHNVIVSRNWQPCLKVQVIFFQDSSVNSKIYSFMVEFVGKVGK